MKIKAKLYHIVQSMGVPPILLHDNAHFTRDLGLDSLEVAEVLTQVEIGFHLTIPASDYTSVLSITALTDYLAARQGQGTKAPGISAHQTAIGAPNKKRISVHFGQ